uniref:Uncharacterized protein n=1 Tax=Cajanus cajan TaxID=3821 RepID=A0A151U4Z5_CAJCA|nr:hypothetical protein KK1_007025 [Cajanus cajan]
MLKLKPYISNQPLPFPNPTSLRLSPHPILCAKSHPWSQPSNRKLLQLASSLAFNLKILPEPLNSLAGEIARRDSQPLRRLLAGRRASAKKPLWFAFALICAAGLWWWRVQEFDLFLRALSFCLAGVSLLGLWLGKKAIKEWFLGFLFGSVLVLSSRLGKEDVRFWVQKLVASSPIKQIVMSKKYRNRNRRTFK